MKKNFSPLSAGPYGNPNECFANASAFHSNGDEEQAIVYFHKALEGYTRTLGATHAHCYQTTYNLGCIYDFRGEMENAKKYFTLTSEVRGAASRGAKRRGEKRDDIHSF